jgi:hypothetical protein
MNEPFIESFGFYGSDSEGRTNMGNGRWLSVSGITGPSYGLGGTDKWWITLHGVSGTNKAYASLGGNLTEVIYGTRVYIGSMQAAAGASFSALFDGDANRLFALKVNSVGVLQAYGPSNTLIGSSAGPVLTTGTAHTVECRVLRDSTNGEVEVYVDGADAPSLNLTNVNTGTVDYSAYGCEETGGTGASNQISITDIWVREVTGDSGISNEDFVGDFGVATLVMVGDTEEDNWRPRYRKNIGTGILALTAGSNDCVSCADAANLEIGADDFTFECFVRFNSLPTGTNKAQIFGKWQEIGNQRSYQLFLSGPDAFGGALVYRTSTDGAAGTVNNVFEFPWEPELDVWYGVTLARESGVTHLMIGEVNPITGDYDYVEQSVGFADAATYFDSTAALAIGAEMSSASSAIANTSIDGWMDEVRFTIGVARETTSYTAAAEPFPRNVGGDPDFADVVLLAGFDNGIDDASSYARTVTARNGAAMLTPDDGEFSYQTINELVPIDDTFIEAALVSATGIFRLTGLPSDGDEVVLGTETYTYVNTLSTAFDVLIGADIEECTANLVAAITAAAGEGTTYGTGTTANADVTAEQLPDFSVLATAIVPGDAGNSLASTTTAANGSWTAATLLGGQDIPDAAEYVIEGLPSDVTRVFSIHIVAREYKSSEGAGRTQFSFVDGQGAAAAGPEQNLTINPAYRTKGVFVTDPTTGGILTPVTMNGSRVRVDRTL